MPAIQPAELWQESGRYEDYGKEMLRFIDRHERPMLYGPTHEEVVTDIFRRSVRSYRDLPVNLYQIQWKFRDEIRPTNAMITRSSPSTRPTRSSTRSRETNWS